MIRYHNSTTQDSQHHGTRHARAYGLWRFVFTVIERTLAAVGLMAALPVLCLAALAVWMENRGPLMIAQQRVGRHGVPFDCYKLRTMIQGAPLAPTHDVGSAYRLKVGALLRQCGIDELPQLWNVVTGTMSLVGPRPSLVSQIEIVEKRRAQGVLTVLPGITGLAQVMEIDMSRPERLIHMDAVYVAQKSVLFDAYIAFKTFEIILKSRKEPRLSGRNWQTSKTHTAQPAIDKSEHFIV